MHPIPEDLVPFYRGGYQPVPASLSELREIASLERYRLAPILAHKSQGKLLEIGPWIGIFSCNAKDAGFDVTAIEIDSTCVEFLNNCVGIRAVQSANPAETMDSMSERFDVIALWHSLEHLRDPWLVVQSAARCLAPGGILLIAIPNIESFEFALLGRRWRHLDAPRHLFFYPREALISLCAECGLSVLDFNTDDELSRHLSRDAWHHWARKIIRIKYLRGVVAKLGFYLSVFKTRKRAVGSGITAVFQLRS
jgi:2-polyprenyl-3-methyl-5-hydroxy-6-metoxy-1,4-benzoquinol methylase